MPNHIVKPIEADLVAEFELKKVAGESRSWYARGPLLFRIEVGITDPTLKFSGTEPARIWLGLLGAQARNARRASGAYFPSSNTGLVLRLDDAERVATGLLMAIEEARKR